MANATRQSSSKEPITSEMRVSKLPFRALRKTINALNIKRQIGKDWRDFAGEIGLTMEDVTMLDRKEDPMHEVLQHYMSSKLPTLGDLMSLLFELERLDVIEILEEATGVESPFTNAKEIQSSMELPDRVVTQPASYQSSEDYGVTQPLGQPGSLELAPSEASTQVVGSISLSTTVVSPSPRVTAELPLQSPCSVSSGTSPLSPSPRTPPAPEDKEPRKQDLDLVVDEDDPESIERLLHNCIIGYKTPADGKKFFDVFVSFHENDRDFVEDKFEPKCRENNLSVCIPERNLVVGADIYNLLYYVIKYACKRTVVIFSPDYVESAFKAFESQAVFGLSPDLRKRLLIPLVYRKCKLPPLFRDLTCGNYPKESHRPYFWTRLIASIK